MRMLWVVVAGTLLTTPALAGQQDAKPVKEKKICRSEQTTGSYFAKRTCHTRDEWKAIDAANTDNAHAALDRARRQAAATTMQ